MPFTPGPQAKKIPHQTTVGEFTLQDDYHWMRDARVQKDIQANPDIYSHLVEENEYTVSALENTSVLQAKLQYEICSRMPSEQSVNWKVGDYYYYYRIDGGQRIYYRKLGSMDAKEEIILDVNQLAESQNFLKVSGFMAPDPSQTKLVYQVDFVGNEKYTIRVLDLQAMNYLTDEIPNSAENQMVWDKNGNGFFYTPFNAAGTNVDEVKYHRLGSDISSDRIIVCEDNPEYMMGINISYSELYLVIGALSSSDVEGWIVSLEDDAFTPRLIKSRQKDIRYDIEPIEDYLYMYTNEVGANYGINRCMLKDLENGSWEPYILHDSEKYLRGVEYTKDFVILSYKAHGLDLIKVHNFHDTTERTISFPDDTYVAMAEVTHFMNNEIMVSYSSLAHPETIYAYNFENNQLSVLKIKNMPSTYNPSAYTIERIWADNNGIAVPISLIYKTDLFKKDGSNPLYIKGYGASGRAQDAEFDPTIISLVDRGFIYAIAHIRGGSELGAAWYDGGKLLNKKNTFEDFIKCTEYLIVENYTSKGKIVMSGGSSGGLLVGAVANMRPDLYKAVVAHAPFVDVLNTMLDSDLFLTDLTYNEFGDPHEPKYFEYIKSYSPYDNVASQNYPHMYITAGIKDERVSYFEPMKWVAKLREMKTDDNIILLRVLEGGHNSSASISVLAEEYTFIMKVFGMDEDAVVAGDCVEL